MVRAMILICYSGAHLLLADLLLESLYHTVTTIKIPTLHGVPHSTDETIHTVHLFEMNLQTD